MKKNKSIRIIITNISKIFKAKIIDLKIKEIFKIGNNFRIKVKFIIKHKIISLIKIQAMDFYHKDSMKFLEIWDKT